MTRHPHGFKSPLTGVWEGEGSSSLESRVQGHVNAVNPALILTCWNPNSSFCMRILSALGWWPLPRMSCLSMRPPPATPPPPPPTLPDCMTTPDQLELLTVFAMSLSSSTKLPTWMLAPRRA